MGSINMPSFAFRTALSEDSGVRSGFALTEKEMLQHLSPDHQLREGLERDTIMRVGSDVYEDTVGDLLFALGAVDEPGMPTLSLRLMRLTGKDLRTVFTLDELMTLEAVGNNYLRMRIRGDAARSKLRDELKGLVSGKPGIWEALGEAMMLHLSYSPNFTRSMPVSDLVSLKSLFESEQLPASPETYFDQRFVNYLGAHPEHLGSIHWRQFEGLAAEWFSRQGYDVQLGQGRNDGSVDLRLWLKNGFPGAPPAVIVQCKRQSRKVERVVVKALYADILEESAASGLVVTTSDVSPGALADISARSYPITTVNRPEVLRWIEAMRKPSAGIVQDVFS